MEELGQGLCLLTRSLLHTHVGRIWRMIQSLSPPRRIGRLISASFEGTMHFVGDRP